MRQSLVIEEPVWMELCLHQKPILRDLLREREKDLRGLSENAPPLIPHSVEGFLPIQASNNACLGCHTPEAAKAAKATPLPASHFADFRPDTKIGKDGEVTKRWAKQ